VANILKFPKEISILASEIVAVVGDNKPSMTTIVLKTGFQLLVETEAEVVLKMWLTAIDNDAMKEVGWGKFAGKN